LIKHQLSSNLIAEKIITFVLIIIAPLLWIGIPEIPIVLFILALVFAIYSFYTIYFVVSSAVFDDTCLFARNRKAEKVINLKNITQIKLTPYYGSFRNMWKIQYIENDQQKSILIFLKNGLVSLTPFVKAVRSKNPSVDIKYISPDFDMDFN